MNFSQNNVNTEQFVRPKNVKEFRAGIENDVATPYNFTGLMIKPYTSTDGLVLVHTVLKKKTTTKLFH